MSATDELGETVRSVKASPLEELAKAKMSDESKIEPKLRARLFEQFLEDHTPYREPKASLDRARAQLSSVQKAAKSQSVMVMAERKEPRETFILGPRGVWDKHGDQVKQDVPPAIAPWPNDAATLTSSGLAKWLTSKENPLTARVFVNHVWQMFFGAGLVRTPDDFGLQGERPIHPEVLDWLAVDFMESGWDIKHLITTIVTSATYQQDSAAKAEALTSDPNNKWLARGPRFRLPSWMLRDAALCSSGLLNENLGGPPVKPYQPAGVWEDLFMGRFKYEPSEGQAQYRRSLYAFWRRSIAPTFLFDSAQRRSCEVKLARTNTPLQALTLLNDETYLEASRALAAQMLKQGNDASAKIEWLIQRVLSRPATPKELSVLTRELNRANTYYQAHPDEAKEFLHFGQQLTTESTAALAAHTLTASLVLNLDETITHE